MTVLPAIPCAPSHQECMRGRRECTCRARYNEGSERFINQDGVDLINDAVVEAPQHQALLCLRQVVSQVVCHTAVTTALQNQRVKACTAHRSNDEWQGKSMTRVPGMLERSGKRRLQDGS